MAELIDKGALVSLVNREKEMSSSEYSVGYIDAINDVNNMIDVLPTTTEAEIRAAAIDEFAEKLKAELSQQIFSDEEKFKYARKEQEAICAQNATWKVAIRLSDYVAEQLKEE